MDNPGESGAIERARKLAGEASESKKVAGVGKMIKAEGSETQKKKPSHDVRADIQRNVGFSWLSGLLYSHP